MTLRRLFSYLLVTLALLGAGSGVREVAASPDETPAALAVGELSAPSPFLAGAARTEAGPAGFARVGVGGRAARSQRGNTSRAERIAPHDAAESRVRSSLESFFQAVPELAQARTGQRSACTTALPPPLNG